MPYSKAFFDLQIHFAQAAADLIDMPLERTLLDYTNLYVRFGLDRAFDPGHPIWRRYIDGLGHAGDMSEWTYRFYLAQAEVALKRPMPPTFGCFSYVVQDARCVRIHFHNVEPTTVSPLCTDRLPERLSELRAMFDHIKRNHKDAARVVGTSWLYNLRAYQRCFPEGYVASARIAGSRFRNMSLWGQFLDRRGCVRPGVAADFIRRLSTTTNIRDLADTFPLQALAVDASIAQFYGFYG
ncbi:hypothetical protein WJ63_28735 [Burkholderia pyrrocinia]|nr:hypothetical protein WJ63_28735 [Burkholderia pyrrocinia]